MPVPVPYQRAPISSRLQLRRRFINSEEPGGIGEEPYVPRVPSPTATRMRQQEVPIPQGDYQRSGDVDPEGLGYETDPLTGKIIGYSAPRGAQLTRQKEEERQAGLRLPAAQAAYQEAQTEAIRQGMEPVEVPRMGKVSRAALQILQARELNEAKAAEAYTLKPNEVRFGPGGKEIARGKAVELTPFEDAGLKLEAEKLKQGGSLQKVTTVDAHGKTVVRFIRPTEGQEVATAAPAIPRPMEKAYQVYEGADENYRFMNDLWQELKQSGVMHGPEGIALLARHMGINFPPGTGMRQSIQMIQAHAGERSYPQDFQAWLQKLDPDAGASITPDQAKSFVGMADTQRRQRYETLQREAKVYGADLSNVVAPSGGGGGVLGGGTQKPATATHTALGRDGKRHYLDSNQNDLGVVQ